MKLVQFKYLLKKTCQYLAAVSVVPIIGAATVGYHHTVNSNFKIDREEVGQHDNVENLRVISERLGSNRYIYKYNIDCTECVIDMKNTTKDIEYLKVHQYYTNSQKVRINFPPGYKFSGENHIWVGDVESKPFYAVLNNGRDSKVLAYEVRRTELGSVKYFPLVLTVLIGAYLAFLVADKKSALGSKNSREYLEKLRNDKFSMAEINKCFIYDSSTLEDLKKDVLPTNANQLHAVLFTHSLTEDFDKVQCYLKEKSVSYYDILDFCSEDTLASISETDYKSLLENYDFPITLKVFEAVKARKELLDITVSYLPARDVKVFLRNAKLSPTQEALLEKNLLSYQIDKSVKRATFKL